MLHLNGLRACLAAATAAAATKMSHTTAHDKVKHTATAEIINSN